ncbi:MAG: bifunctional adenosylcobinamide kinase/adenosylcobinamide-phosphate guanylyltransferase [Candidatus Abyssubacteria bacterium]
MARIILITGGSRSGKSTYAQKLAESLPGARAFVATSPATDAEMRERIRRHRRSRSRSGWHTIEEPVDLAGVLNRADAFDVVLVDCLTLWVSNLMYQAEQDRTKISESVISRKCRELIRACAQRSGHVLFVTNEVGMGIVPDNALARQFRDLAGRCNQTMAAAADEVMLMTCGLPLRLKKGNRR